MDERDVDLRNRTYARFVELGRAPTAVELGDPDDVTAGWRRLHDAHALVLNRATDEIRMLNPFSAVPTAYRVRARDRWWYANCAWDALGVCAALGADGRIECSCADCGEPVAVDIRDEKPEDETLLFHVLVPARHWWDDIVFT
ncbi:MAG TPA: organomercurial lyase [Gaiellaceae bacterium]|nr:organomercurial lyase [Gaiellaceae bacterium]